MSLWNALPLPAQISLLLVVGIALGGPVNWAIYWLAYDRRPISPWTPRSAAPAGRGWADCLPIVGWLRLRRERNEFGPRFWVRPLMIEIGLGLALAAHYAWLASGGLLPEGVAAAEPVALARYGGHVLLLLLLVAATFIDFDEFHIPDVITVPGVLAALALAVVAPVGHLPAAEGERLGRLWMTSPFEWDASPDGPRGLAYGLAALIAWWLALMPVLWTYRRRRGLGYSARMLVASLTRRAPAPLYWLLMTLTAAAAIVVWRGGGESWRGLLTALVGMAFAGGMVWMVRVVGGVALGKEAMGFGDVTLMAMIGAFLGWQPSLIVFFMAPFFGILFAIAQAVFRGETMLPYGPYLSLGAATVVVAWRGVWFGWADRVFALGWWLPALLLVGFMLMGVLLGLWRAVKVHVFRLDDV